MGAVTVPDTRPEKVAGVDLVDTEDWFATVRIERLAVVPGRMFYKVSTDRDAFTFYVTPSGLLRGLSDV